MAVVTQSNNEQLALPRFCTVEQLAAEFGFSAHWIYKLNKRGKGPPRLPNVRPYRYDTHSRAFREWLAGLGVDLESLDTAET
jgi:(p)ppGpp synthase/HD superfamily hydrolase